MASPVRTDTNATGINARPANCTTPIAGTATTFASRPAAVARWNQRAVIGSSTISIASVATARVSIGLARRLHRSLMRAVPPCPVSRRRCERHQRACSAERQHTPGVVPCERITQPLQARGHHEGLHGGCADVPPVRHQDDSRDADGSRDRRTAVDHRREGDEADRKPPQATSARRPRRHAAGTAALPARWRRCRPRSRRRDTRPRAAGRERSRGPGRYDRR